MTSKLEYPQNCRNCDDFDTCPYPDLMTVLKQLANENFNGEVSIAFDRGIPGKVTKEQVIEFVRFG